jgi:hypothetical protein
MKDVSYEGKRAGTPALSVNVPTATKSIAAQAPAAAVKEKTPSQPQFETADIVRHRRQRRESRLNETADAKASPLTHPLH